MGAAEKLPEKAEELEDAINDRSAEQVERIMGGLRYFAREDFSFRIEFDRTVREHREAFQRYERLLQSLGNCGTSMLVGARGNAALARELETVMPNACKNIRTVRALADLLSNEQTALKDDPEAAERAKQLCAEHAERRFAELPEQERRDLACDKKYDLESWLNAP